VLHLQLPFPLQNNGTYCVAAHHTKKLAKFGFSFSFVLVARKKSAHQLEKLRQYQLIDVGKVR